MKKGKMFVKLASLLAITGFAAVLAAPSESRAASSATAYGYAYVVAPFAISTDQHMMFGKLVPGTGGTIVLTPGGLRSATGGVILYNQGSTHYPAKFTVTGDGASTYAVNLPDSATLSNGTSSMTVNSFTSNPSGTGTLTAGTGSLAVGATLNVASAQPVGTYTGTFSVSVDYN